jgi:signal transduction histidine kinase
VFAQALGLSVISSQPQVEVTGGASDTRQTTTAVADTAGKVATRWGHVRHLLLRASVVLLLILFAASSALSVRAYVLYQGADSTTANVIGASNSLLIELLDAETGQRGYLLTSNPRYLQPYDSALLTIPADQQRLRSEISAVPGGRRDLAELNSLVATKRAELAMTISMARAGNHAGALRIVEAGEGKQIMDNARGVIADLQRAATGAGASRGSALLTQLTVFIILAFSLAAAEHLTALFLRSRLRRAAKEIRSLNANLERQVQHRTMHLEQANKSLEAFAYSVAHDLRTPLRGISGFAEALTEDYGDRLDETGREYAARVEAGCARMATLIDDLLHLSQVTRAKMNLQDVDLSAEVTAICDQLRARDSGRKVRVTVQDDVHVTADRALIRSALKNLLENAWKFTAGRDGAAIEFATAPVGDAPVCCYVRDNGVGFDPAYVGKLFQPFQQLHDASEFPGTGIGLASVRRIIERHGGRTWAEGAVDGGATIYFTLNAEVTS